MRVLLYCSNCRYDEVAVGLQTRLDEKEYKAREIADFFKDFKREVCT
jgi:hypothetical protein